MNNKYYVTMTDKFLSGWGKAEGKINKLVLECDTYEEAEIVAENAKDVGCMKNIKIIRSKAKYSTRTHLVSYHDKSDYVRWYIKDTFKWR